jgi:hypothetical protein
VIAFRQIYDDAPEFVQVSIPKELQHQRVEVTVKENKKSIMSYAGIARGLWGESADEIDNFIRDERDSWQK